MSCTMITAIDYLRFLDIATARDTETNIRWLQPKFPKVREVGVVVSIPEEVVAVFMDHSKEWLVTTIHSLNDTEMKLARPSTIQRV